MAKASKKSRRPRILGEEPSQLTCYFDKEQWRWLTGYAFSRKVSAAFIIREFVDQGIAAKIFVPGPDAAPSIDARITARAPAAPAAPSHGPRRVSK